MTGFVQVNYLRILKSLLDNFWRGHFPRSLSLRWRFGRPASSSLVEGALSVRLRPPWSTLSGFLRYHGTQVDGFLFWLLFSVDEASRQSQFCEIFGKLPLQLHLKNLSTLGGLLDKFLNDVVWAILESLVVGLRRWDIPLDDPRSFNWGLQVIFLLLLGSQIVRLCLSYLHFGRFLFGATEMSLSWLERVSHLFGIYLTEPGELGG